MTVILKIKFNADLHRVHLEEDKLSFESVRAAIEEVHSVKTFAIKYLDEDSDFCTLCPSTFPDFVNHFTQHGENKVLKVELFELNAGEAKNEVVQQAASEGSKMDGVDAQRDVLGSFLRMGLNALTSFIGKGRHGYHVDRHGAFKLKMLKFSVAQLYQNGQLDAESFAALLVNCLPQLMSFIANHPDKINWKLGAKMVERMEGKTNMQLFLEDLHALVVSTQGLAQCEAVVGAWRDQQTTASEALLQLLPALIAMPFDEQVAFARALYMRQEERLKSELKRRLDHHPWMPVLPMVHEGITCDGCNKSPIQGLRFKCKTLPDYDLCVGCFLKRNSLLGGACGMHEFETKPFPDPCEAWQAICKGKGRGKCKGWMAMCKGKGKGKRHFSCDEQKTQQAQPRPCANEGCTYAATWHPTHCCGACAHGRGHGGRCEKIISEVCNAEEPASPTEKTSAPEEGATEVQQALDMEFPVEVADGRQLNIGWNHGDDPRMVAEGFAAKHHILPDEVPTIEAFVQEATMLHVKATETSTTPDHKADELKQSQQQPEAEEDDLAKTAAHLAEAGLGSAEVLLQLLRANGGSVQRTLEELLNQ
jgi:hypothetical protein